MKSLLMRLLVVVVVCFFAAVSVRAQSQQVPGTNVPRLIKYSGSLLDGQGSPVKGPLGVTFALYSQQSGGGALWMETQNVEPDASGNYTVLLGSASANGIPEELFASGEARWLGVQAEKQPEQPRVLLVSVPYALKAGDAQTLAGRPASDFALAGAPPAFASLGSASAAVAATTAVVASGQAQAPLATTIGGGGTINDIPIWTGSATLGNSVMSQAGGNVSVAGGLQLPSTGTAVAGATGGRNSRPFELFGSTFNSTLAAPVPQHFRLQEEPVGQSTASPSGKVSLLYAPGSAALAETGFSVNSKGLISFATGQTFPGTVTSVGLSAPSSDFKVTGSPVTKSGTVSLNWKVAPTSADIPNAIVKRDGSGNFTAGAILGTLGVEGKTALNCSGCAGVSGVNTGGGIGLQGLTSGNAAVVLGQNSSTSGAIADGVDGVTSSAGGSGVAGINNSGGIGVFGVGGTGVLGEGSNTGFGFEGTSGSGSVTGAGTCCTAVWGDTGVTGNAGVIGTADDGFGVVAVIDSGTDKTVEAVKAVNRSTTVGAAVLFAIGGVSCGAVSCFCAISVSGDLECLGSKSAVVPVEDGQKMVALYAEESPENWFADYGSGQLQSGVATVKLDPTFAQTVNTSLEYHVFPVPNGDCNGLYVTNKTATSFQVRELKGGHSNIGFDYRIIAKRKGYEQIRLADKTARMKAAEMSAARFSRKPAAPSTLRARETR